jgi:hypothetical protein
MRRRGSVARQGENMRRVGTDQRKLHLLPIACLIITLCAYSSAAQDSVTRGFTVVGTSAKTDQSVEVMLYRRMVAVVIGIDRYADAQNNLTYAVHDAEGFRDTLRDQYVFEPVYTLFNEEATRDAILSLLLTQLPRETTPDDAVVVFFSGHGDTLETPDGSLGYLVPHDGAFGQGHRNVSMSMLRDDISRALPARHVCFIIDACYGGLLTTRSGVGSTDRSIDYLQSIANEKARQVLTAGGQDEQVLDGGPLGYGVFTGRVIEALQHAPDYITASELALTVREKVFSDAQARQHQQTPAYGYLSGTGDMVFVPRRRNLEDIATEVETLEDQLAAARVESRQAEAERDTRLRSESLQREAALAEDLRQAKARERIEQERQRREQEVEERERQQEARRLREAADTLQTEQHAGRLRRQIEEEKARQETLRTVMTLSQAMQRRNDIRSQLNAIDAQVRREIDNEEKLIPPAHVQPIQPRGEFETQDEYEARRLRIEEANSTEVERVLDEAAKISSTRTQRVREAKKAYEAALAALHASEYRVDHKSLNLSMDRYDLDLELFPATVVAGPGRRTQTIRGLLDIPRSEAPLFRTAESQGLLLLQATGRLPTAGPPIVEGVTVSIPGGSTYALDPSQLVVVSSTPVSAQVFVDDQLIGESPLSARIPFGARAVRLSANGYRDHVAPLQAGNAMHTVDATLVPKQWDLRVRLSRSERAVLSIAFSPDGTSLVGCGADSRVRTWGMPSQRAREGLSGHGGTLRSVAYSHDGALVAGASAAATVWVWNVQRLREPTAIGMHRYSSQLAAPVALVGHADVATSVAFAPSGPLLISGSSDGSVKLWNASTTTEIASFNGHEGGVSTVAFFPDGSQIASGGSDSDVLLWDVVSKQPTAVLAGHESDIVSVAFSPDGSLLASSSSDKSIRLWDVTTQETGSILQAGQRIATSVAFSPDGTLLASGHNNARIVIWDVESGEKIATLNGHSDPVTSVAFSPNGALLASGGYDRSVILWEVR